MADGSQPEELARTVSFGYRSLFNINWIEFEIAGSEVLGLNDELDKFKIFPNPGKDYLILQSVGGLDFCQIQMFDISEYSGDQLTFTNKLKPGLYLMSLINNDSYIKQKIIIELWQFV